MIEQLQQKLQKSMDEISVIRKRFGDEQSNLLDQFERLSFEAHLNRAMLGRSLSEPGMSRLSCQTRLISVAPSIPLVAQVNQGRRRRRGLGFHKVLKKLLKPILGRRSNNNGGRKQEMDAEDPMSWKHLSRSMRF